LKNLDVPAPQKFKLFKPFKLFKLFAHPGPSAVSDESGVARHHLATRLRAQAVSGCLGVVSPVTLTPCDPVTYHPGLRPQVIQFTP
jgi:hypothetical protein